MFASLAVIAAAISSVAPASPAVNGGVDLLPGRTLQQRTRDEGLVGLYPPEALRAGVSGKVTLDCKVAADGVVHSCGVTAETPKGQGFAEASLKAVSTYRFARVTIGAGDVPVRIPFVWDAKAALAYVVKPVWIQRPSREDITAAAPAVARDRYSGARVDCRVAPDGRLTACHADMASPPESIVGAAAIVVATKALRLAPEDGFDIRTAGRRVRASISFPQTEGTPPPPLMVPPVSRGDMRDPRAAYQPSGAPPIAAPGASSAPLPSVISNPRWEKRPTPANLAAAYPPAALANGVAGRSTMVCQIAASGALQACEIASEDPVGAGFGKATLSLAAFFKVEPLIRDGQPVGGRTVRIPVLWRPPEAPTP